MREVASGPPESTSPLHSQILALPSGSSFKRVDLHVHTPGSRDMGAEWRDVTPVDVVRLALEAGLDVIAVTDHNTVDWCKPS
jgi:DNA polymerase III alpha subunit (gram-positive type)